MTAKKEGAEGQDIWGGVDVSILQPQKNTSHRVNPHDITNEKNSANRIKVPNKTYVGIVRCGESRIARHPKAQKAYAPWASNPGDADTPPSYVWPK